MLNKILITGFEPFAGETINPSLEAVKLLEGEVLHGYLISVAILPCVFNESISKLLQAIEIQQPQIIICVGLASSRSDISIERVAININDARIADNNGQQPIDEAIVENGPAAYFSTLPIKAIVNELTKKDIPASVSQTAGTFVCNHVFYALMHYLAREKQSCRGGFIHIPYLPEQVINRPGIAAMELRVIVTALRIAIITTINYQKDILISGGKED